MNKTDREAADLQPGFRSVARPLLLLSLLMAFAGPAFAVGIKPESVGGALYGRASPGTLYGRAFVPALARDTPLSLGRTTQFRFHSGVSSIIEHCRALPALASGFLNGGKAPVQNDSDWRRVGKSLSHREIAAFALEELAYIVIIALIVFTGAGARCWELLSSKIRRVRTARVVYLAGVLILLGLIGLPFDLWRYHTDRVFGLSNQTLLEWLGDYAIVAVTGFVIALPVLLGIYWLVKRKPRTWWRWTAAAAVPFIGLAVLAGPYYAYLFNTFTPLQNKQLAAEVLALASKAGVNVNSVYQTNLSRQTRAANAYVAGLGGSKRLVLGDTLIQNFTDQEILFATAHEIGHYVMNHVLIGFVFTVVGVAIFLFLVQHIGERVIIRFRNRIGVESAYDPPALLLGVVIALVLSLAGLPVVNAFSRYLEHRADEFAAVMTIPSIVSPEQAADAFEKLGRLGLSDPDPNPIIEFIFWDHPPLDKREEFVLNFRR